MVTTLNDTPEPPKVDWYSDNPLIHRDRRLGASASEWVRSFSCEDMKPLIVCRGPVRKEAIDVFREMGMQDVGILLSEKDSIVFPNAHAPDLRQLDAAHVHRVPDYSGATKAERKERIQQIIQIAKQHSYTHVFAGYGFMAEDVDFVRALEDADVGFIGPSSGPVHAAGRKDEAKRTALEEEVSVTPGIDDSAARTVVAKAKDAAGLEALAKKHGLDTSLVDGALEVSAARLLRAAQAASVDLHSIDELAAQVQAGVSELLDKHPGRQVRLKAVGGGGGKGQRILSDPKTAKEKVREILAEVKATGVGDDKNLLIELNIETTRHHEIQLLGNGEWALALGGRDCSLQMHDQKLLEISITQESLTKEIKRSKDDAPERAQAIREDLETLRSMEAESERFGVAVGLDSVSTFECIVDGTNHYFMEVNTRIQVEHRVTELVYSLRFRNPFNREDYFDVYSLVEAMAMLAKHKKRLPKPERMPRKSAAIEARLNATDEALHPHAGGQIVNWSDPIEGEIRDDQGISIKNPDTGLFMRYRIAGAYDSNVALLVTHGEDRAASFDRLNEILRLTRMRGLDLATNLEFHYGLVNWFRARDTHAKATTRFVVPYLTQVGLLQKEAQDLDVGYAFSEIRAHYGEDSAEVLTGKQTLIQRPMNRLLSCPHVLSGWLSMHRNTFAFENGRLEWLENPLRVLADTYHSLNMDLQEKAAPSQVIWAHDHELLSRALAFYDTLESRVSESNYVALTKILDSDKAPTGFDDVLWRRVRASHAGFTFGLELLGLLPMIGVRASFYELKLKPDLTVAIPDRLHDAALQKEMRQVLAPPPATRANEILAASGGMFYSKEAPDLPPLVREGEHFEQGQPIYLIEVMKMFNRVLAPFSGTIDKALVTVDGAIVSKGQPLFSVTPDQKIVDLDPAEEMNRRRAHTRSYLDALL